ncbi:hypothetical protein LZ198_25925 [Myxococcus sp. K15C18031901]|uniref:hypothetical protein n=1 Tax=Myxococcus dinghuensis TaxID=2906761 RepID=UPI0020A7577E|nr:hypothetical protein [Myxococcus dinghuensis]MCP3102314.1 hypothetical protein [Myxococcus dinghuensis]
MLRMICVVAMCAFGLTACGSGPDTAGDELGSTEQGLACEYGTGACPGTTVCAWFPDQPDEGLCRPACVNGACTNGQTCCTQRTGAPYCNSVCF